jgi:phenylalanyl-tRNA synthetase alpha chain
MLRSISATSTDAMSSSDNKPEQTLADLGVTQPDQVLSLFAEVRARFDGQVSRPLDHPGWEILRQSWLGRKSGVLMLIAEHWLKPAAPDLKRSVGQELNKLKAHLETTLEERRLDVESLADHAASIRDRVDLSLPGVTRPSGSHHLIRRVFQEIEDIFFSIGFSVVEGPEIETPYYNFEALNIPEFHPVRDDMDTFYLELPTSPDKKTAPSPLLLRTHTSPMQIRTMEKQKPPVRVIVPGKVYRRDNPDATHSFAFHQIEGLAVDTDITFCDFTGTIEYFVQQFFGPSVKTRFRPSYFPFTEPSVEFDVSCPFCGGTGASNGNTCSKCKGAAWIELFGAGMVDPAVYGFVNYDAKKVSGFAFGIGIDRLAMLKYGIDDIQIFFQNDVRFLRQFP